jgi:hypothetical protein
MGIILLRAATQRDMHRAGAGFGPIDRILRVTSVFKTLPSRLSIANAMIGSPSDLPFGTGSMHTIGMFRSKPPS